MVQTINDEYIIGGTAQGFLYVPNLKSFKQFMQYGAAIGSWSYMQHAFKGKDLILLEFPAFFYLDSDNYWALTTKSWCLKEAEYKVRDYKTRADCIDTFIKQVSKIEEEDNVNQ